MGGFKLGDYFSKFSIFFATFLWQEDVQPAQWAGEAPSLGARGSGQDQVTLHKNLAG